jgi:hypothetical protein
MPRKDHEQLDVYEMERIVAQALLELADDPEQKPITFSLLVKRSDLPKHRVREVVDAWELRTVSGEEYLLTPALLERVRSVLKF